MNLYELDYFISTLDKVKDKNLIKFYLQKRKELVKQIFNDLSNKLK